MSVFDYYKRPLPDNNNRYLYLQGYTPQEILEYRRKEIFTQVEEQIIKENVEIYVEECLDNVLGDLLDKYSDS